MQVRRLQSALTKKLLKNWPVVRELGNILSERLLDS